MHMNILTSLKGVWKLQRAQENLEGVAVPLRPTPLVLQSLVSRWAGWEVRTTRCCMSLQVRFLLEHVYMQVHAETHAATRKEKGDTHTCTHSKTLFDLFECLVLILKPDASDSSSYSLSLQVDSWLNTEYNEAPVTVSWITVNLE